MTILLDPPTWPAHDRLWSHLVSDTSLHELRTFARAAGVPDRGFDLDHYDVPAERYDDLLAAGAVPLDGRALARRLGASVLRVPGHERRRAARAVLLTRWAALWRAGARDAPDEAGPGAAVAAVGVDLVDRWREPHRVYHSRLHLADVLDRLDDLRADGAPGSGWHAAVALWFHDAVHDGATPADERASAALVDDLLGPLVGGPSPASPAGTGTGGSVSTAAGSGGAETRAREPLTAADVSEVARLVLLTAGHDPAPDDATGALVSDADLAVLGSPPSRYARYVAQVRAEYGHVPDDAFRHGRAAVVEQLLTLHRGPGLYRTDAGRRRWAAGAAANLAAESAGPSGGESHAPGAQPGPDGTAPGARNGAEIRRHEGGADA